MAYKRQTDRLPIIPADATEHNAVCHYCIVGCGYKAYTWPMNRQGGTAPNQNKFGVDLSEQQLQDAEAWYAPSMYNIVKKDGRDVHLVVKPDVNCVVNSGLASVRGARMAENHPSTVTGTQQHRLTDPLVWRYGSYQPTSWEDAYDLVARVTARHHCRERRGRSDRVDVRPWRLGRRLREHLGDGQALFRVDEGQERPHPQPPGLQLRGARHAGHGRRRAEQRLRGCRPRRHARGLGLQPVGMPDELFPQPLDPEPSGHHADPARKS